MKEYKIHIKEVVKGYFIIEADTEEEAIEEAELNLLNNTARSYNNVMAVDWLDDVIGIIE